jgi:tricorn protease
MGLWEGASSRHGGGTGVRHRLATWLPDGERIAAVSDEGGEEGLVVFPAAGRDRGRKRSARRFRGDFGRAVELAAAPGRTDRLALSNQRQELWVVDLPTGRSAMVERSAAGRIEGLAWSPDGRYLAYGFPETRRVSTIRVCDVATGKIYPLTRPEFRDVRPAFDPEGKYLYFISWRVLDPVYDSIYFDLGFPRGARPYLIPLRADQVSPFSDSVRAPRAPGLPFENGDLETERALEAARNRTARAQQMEERRAPPVQVTIDFEGITDRVVALPVPDGRYGRILGGRGRILFSVYPIEGSLHHDWSPKSEPEANGILQAYDFAHERVDTIADHITDFTVSLTGKAIALRVGNRIRVLAVNARANGRRERPEVSRETGWIDLDRLRVSVIPAEEWAQMFREAWRLQRDQFWTPDMSGVDWQAIHDRYLPLVARVASRAEFSDLLWEMQGELGTSHCYELGGDYRPEPGWMQAHLGADLAPDPATGRWRVLRIPRGDPWTDEASSPLAAPGLGIREGDELLAVGGEPVGKDVSPYERLVNLAHQNVELTVRSSSRRGRRVARDGKGVARESGTVRTITIKTLGHEFALRYRDWVARNREQVHKATEGRVGYVHVPDMGPRGYAEFHRSYLSEVDRDGLVIDVRWNGGGHVSQLLLEKLLRRRVGYDMNRWGVPEPYPTDSPAGPMVAITNEYAGSDGDIFSHCFKLFGLGPLVGKRTWGGVVGIWPRHALVDGTVTTQPEFAFWFEDVGWGVENYGTDPDVEVEIRPQDHAAGRDPQIERALVEIRKQLTRRPPRQPDFSRRPQLAPLALPPVSRNGSRTRVKAATARAAAEPVRTGRKRD